MLCVLMLNDPFPLTLTMILMSAQGTVSRSMLSMNLVNQRAPLRMPTARRTSLSRSSFSSTMSLIFIQMVYMKANTRNMGRMPPIFWMKLGVRGKQSEVSGLLFDRGEGVSFWYWATLQDFTKLQPQCGSTEEKKNRKKTLFEVHNLQQKYLQPGPTPILCYGFDTDVPGKGFCYLFVWLYEGSDFYTKMQNETGICFQKPTNDKNWNDIILYTLV